MADPIILDARDLKCPLPVLKARRAMKPLAPGAVLRVLATDPGAPADFRHFCDTTGHRLVAERDENGVLVFEIEKRE
ncbi:MAG: sulfurtransferase TusA family protein [Stellaceae bacterium]